MYVCKYVNYVCMYRVAQNKMSHRTKSNFFATIGVCDIKIQVLCWRYFCKFITTK